MVRAGRSDWSEREDPTEEVPADYVIQEIYNMKPSKFTFAIVALLLFSLRGWASDKRKANIQIDQTVHVGSAQLAPGEYKMTWTESGLNAEVAFSRGNKVIATVAAQVSHVRSGYNAPALLTDSSNTLTEVDLPKVSLSFSSENVVSPSSSN
jgi:hypothetical protein